MGEICSFRDLASQFSELYSWLNTLQESILYLKDDDKENMGYMVRIRQL